MTSDPGTQHLISAAAIALPAYSIWAHLPEIVTVMLGILGIIWYTIQIYEWVRRKVKGNGYPPSSD